MNAGALPANERYRGSVVGTLKKEVINLPTNIVLIALLYGAIISAKRSGNVCTAHSMAIRENTLHIQEAENPDSPTQVMLDDSPLATEPRVTENWDAHCMAADVGRNIIKYT